jgi:D-3-phosphoglycerate dehydrogenase
LSGLFVERKALVAKVLVADKISSGGIDILINAGLDVDVKTGLSEDEVVAIAGEYDGIIVRSATKITKRVIDAASKLGVVGRAGVGVDNIDLDAATAKGVVVMNTPLGNITSAAEHALALMMSMARHIPAADASMKAGEWDKKAFTGTELSGKTLGVVGLGKIGAIVTRVAQAAGMQVVTYDPYLSPKRAEELDVECVDMDALLERADLVTIHVPLNDATRGLIGEAEFAKMKKTARLVNCARGGVVDEDALVKALETGEIAGAAMDVFVEEPLAADSSLRKAPNIILTPHLGASTSEAQEKVAEDLARQFVDYFTTGKIKNPVNLAVTMQPHLVPFAALAEKLGSFASQMVNSGITGVEVGCYGEVGSSAEDGHVIAVSALQGVLGRLVDETVNLVNVSVVAESRGIELNERRSETARTFRNTVVVKVIGDGRERSVAGALFEGREERIVQIDDFDIDVLPAPWMLFMAYPDLPGMVGKFGTLLGEANINIAGMSVGRREKSGLAVVVLTVDDPVGDDVLDQIRSAVDAEEVRRIQL